MLWATKSFNSTLNAEWMNSPHLKANQTGSSMGLVVSKVASWSSGLGSNPGLSNFCKRPKHFKLVDIESILINRIAQRRHITIAAFRKGEICFNSHSIESSEHKSSLLHFDTKITVIEKVTSHTHTQHAYSIQHTHNTHTLAHTHKRHTQGRVKQQWRTRLRTSASALAGSTLAVKLEFGWSTSLLAAFLKSSQPY